MKHLRQLLMLALASCAPSGTTWLGEHIVEAGVAGSSADAGLDGPPSDFFARYEAESPDNLLTFPVEGISKSAACPVGGVTEGAPCSSNGAYVAWILGRSPCQPPTSRSSFDGCQDIGGGVLFNQVTVPAAGDYDVTWWYHCGEDPAEPGVANVFGDKLCGGLAYGTGAGSGCRSHLIDVNGVPVTATIAGKVAPYFHFPCYPGPWGILHGATTTLPLKAGSNTILMHAPSARMLATADIDALDVQAMGHGVASQERWPKLVAPVESPE